MIRALIVVCVFFIFQQITGINIPFYYGPTILGKFFQGGNSAVEAAVAGVEVTAILGAVNVVATYFAFRWIDKFGRRPLAIGGYAGMAFSCWSPRPGWRGHRHPEDRGGHGRLLVLHHVVRDRRGRHGLADPGRGLPDRGTRPAAAIGAAVDWVAKFALIEAFPAWQNAWGLAWVMVSFAVLAVVAIGFVYKFLPETKGLSVEQAVQVFEREAEASKAPV